MELSASLRRWLDWVSSAYSKSIIKMSVESLVISQLNYALAMWSPSLNKDLSSRLCQVHNQAIRITCGLRKYNHVSEYRRGLRWLSLDHHHT